MVTLSCPKSVILNIGDRVFAESGKLTAKSYPASIAAASISRIAAIPFVRQTRSDNDDNDDIDDISPQPLSFATQPVRRNRNRRKSRNVLYQELKPIGGETLFRHCPRRRRRHFRLKSSQFAQNACAEFDEIAEICESRMQGIVDR